jgi:hypothetical protein
MGGFEDLPRMKLTDFPPYEDGESLEVYLRRSLHTDAVSIGALARYLTVERGALYKIKNGGGAAPETLVRFGAMLGVIPDWRDQKPGDRPPVDLLALLGLVAPAEHGWRTRTLLLAQK